MTYKQFNTQWVGFKYDVGDATQNDFELFNQYENSIKHYPDTGINKIEGKIMNKNYCLGMWVINRKRKIHGHNII